MTAKDNGGQDSPAIGHESIPDESGMSLRDWFAGQALMGMLAFPGVVGGSSNKSGKSVAASAYVYADYMLQERHK